MVDVGITKIELPWRIFANKELDVRFFALVRPRGPGRSVVRMGRRGLPDRLVRWTEQRKIPSLPAFLGTGGLDLGAITTRRVKFEDALPIYQTLGDGGSNDVGW
ncbi:MAG: hypothetical protein Ct9H300mP32_4400 [Verrucomicrobiota bacterium]|nr:MAG: hypothetical protein Ct9H300mP32_4400 [Verrucomicrobiota bacterium]